MLASQMPAIQSKRIHSGASGSSAHFAVIAGQRSRGVFMLWGTAFVLPMILGYTAWSYWVFRGKVNSDGYHA